MFARKDYNLASGFNATQLYDFVKASLVDAGWGTVVDEFNQGVPTFVLKPLSSGPFASRMHFRVEVQSYMMAMIYLCDGWNPETHSYTRQLGNYGSIYAAVGGTSLNLAVFTDPGVAYTCFNRQGSSSLYMANFIKPTLLHPGWASSSIFDWFMWADTTLYGFTGNGNNPWNTSNSNFTNLTFYSQNTVQALDPLTNLRQIESNIPLANYAGVQGYLPETVGRIAGIVTSSEYLDTYTVGGTEEWVQVTYDTFRSTVLRTE